MRASQRSARASRPPSACQARAPSSGSLHETAPPPLGLMCKTDHVSMQPMSALGGAPQEVRMTFGAGCPSDAARILAPSQLPVRCTMTKPLTLAIVLSLMGVGSAPALAGTTAKTVAGTPASQAWVDKSNQYAHVLLNAQAPFAPEEMSFMGVPGYDGRVTDLKPEFSARFRAATEM